MPKTPKWEPLDPEKQIWTAQYYVPGYISRSSGFLSRDKRLLLYGPGPSLIDILPPELSQTEPAPMALIPNAFHHMGVKAWRERYPQLITVAAPGALKRLQKKGHRDIQPLDRLKKELPENISVLEPVGLGYGEVWLRVQREGEVTWIVGDAFFNYARYSKKFKSRLTQKILQAAPGLKMSSVVKYFLIKNRKEYKDWLMTQLDQDRPTTLVPVHGEILRDSDLPTKIRDLVLKRL